MKAHNRNDGMGSKGECDRCGKKFKTLGGLKIHYASHVRDDQKFSCSICTKKFRKQEALEMHLKTDRKLMSAIKGGWFIGSIYLSSWRFFFRRNLQTLSM